MTISLKVNLPDGQYIGVTDDFAGEQRLIDIYKQYGECTVEAYDRNDIFGKGYEAVEPMCEMKLTEMLEDIGVLAGGVLL